MSYDDRLDYWDSPEGQFQLECSEAAAEDGRGWCPTHGEFDLPEEADPYDRNDCPTCSRVHELQLAGGEGLCYGCRQDEATKELLGRDLCARCYDAIHGGHYASDRCSFAEPGGRSALRAAGPGNPRCHPCPNCGAPDRLTPQDKARGYQCDSCADQAERGGW